MGILTTKFGVDLCKDLVNSIVDNLSTYYFFLGKSDSWANSADNAPPLALDNVEQTEQSIYSDIVFGKRIFANNIMTMVPRYNWIANTVYANYDPFDDDLYSKNFFVLTSANAVYKCLFNAGGAPSLVEPSLTDTSGTFSTSDNYVWKYLYTVDSYALSKFGTSQFIPVTPNPNVAFYATPGAIDFIGIANSGSYQVHKSGLIQSILNPRTLVIESDASNLDDYYVGSAIYLSDGPSAGQLRIITDYDATAKALTFVDPLDTYARLTLSDTNVGNVYVGEIATQTSDVVTMVSRTGYIVPGATYIQSDTGAVESVVRSNTSIATFERLLANSSSFVIKTANTEYPAYDPSNVIQINPNSSVTTTNGSANVVGVNTSFTTTLSVGSFLQTGANGAVRRITSITNNTLLSVASVYNTSLTTNTYFKVVNAFVPLSITSQTARGIVSYVNINSVRVSYANLYSSFISGEVVDMVDVSNMTQGSNGIVSFINSPVSQIELSSVNGNFQAGFYLLGRSSLAKAYISQIDSFPNVTVAEPTRDFVIGQKVYFFPSITSNSPTGNSIVQEAYNGPSLDTHYVIAPQVVINGDGEGALAYAAIDDQTNSIEEIVIINTGNGYSWANAVVVSNTIYSTNASIVPLISPTKGHGSDPYNELGARYASINITFSDLQHEDYKFPTKGNYRRIGILRDPLFNDAFLGLSNFTTYSLSFNSVGNFTVGEYVYQANSGAVGLVQNKYVDVTSNQAFLQLTSVQGTFTNGSFKGLTSNASGNCLSVNTTPFTFSGYDTVYQVGSGVTANIAQILSSNTIRVTNVPGNFVANTIISSNTSNAMATIATIKTSNQTINVTTNFGFRFNQTMRIPVTGNTLPFIPGEYVKATFNGNGSGMVLNSNSDYDILFANTITFNVGDTLSGNSATCTVIWANSSYARVTNANGNFANVSILKNAANTTASVNAIYPVLNLVNTKGFFSTSNTVIQGNTSGSTGYINVPNGIINPDLVQDSGTTLYIDNIAKISKTANTSETFAVIINF